MGRWAGGPVGRWAGGPVGRWAGGQQKDYDILFLLAIDVINYDKKLFIKGYNGQTSQTRNRKNYCDIPLYFKCDVWPLQLLINNPVFDHNICGFSDE